MANLPDFDEPIDFAVHNMLNGVHDAIRMSLMNALSFVARPVGL